MGRFGDVTGDIPYDDQAYYDDYFEFLDDESGEESDFSDGDDLDYLLAYSVENVEEHENFLDTLAPGERASSDRRIVRLGSWRQHWKRGLRQKAATLRTHRTPQALRKGRRKVYEFKRGVGRVIPLQIGERIPAYAHEYPFEYPRAE